MNDKPVPDDDAPPASPAATLVIFRHSGGAAPDLLMVERAKSMAFAGGAIVFPGGRVDDDDHAILARSMVLGADGLDANEAAARVTALRETLEESGLPMGFAETPDASWVARARAELEGKRPFSELLAESGLALDISGLVPFARWRPRFREARVFDTRFYIARAADDAPDPQVDATENVHSFWDSAANTLQRADRGEVHVIFPTRRNLERLALFSDFDAACAQARAHPVREINPFMEDREGVPHLCIPEGLGYPVTAEPLERVRRGS